MPKDTYIKTNKDLLQAWRAGDMTGPVPKAVDTYRDPDLFTREDYMQSLMAPGHDPNRFG